MLNTPNETYGLLEDSPTNVDAFHSHKKIAEAIGTIIEKNDGGITIGLEGEWGSGKSSIIKILKEKLEKDQTAYFFSFDAWVHQGDPLRRAFLESLITTALAGEWLGEKPRPASAETEINIKWTKRRNELSSRVKTVVKNSQPDIAGFHKWLLFSLIFAPFGSALAIGVLAKYGFHISLSSWPLPIPDWFFLLGAAVVLLPVLIFILGLLVFRKDEDGKTRLWVALLQKTHVSETVHTVESLDASTLEFQTVFQDFIDQLLHDPAKKLVIVLDNMDRLPPDEAAEVWPVLRSFIDNPAFADAEWAKRLWVLIPYARGTLAVPTVKADEDGPVGAPEGQNDDLAPALAKNPHFLDKVFQVKIFVPPPVLSNWRAYLEKMLKDAFKQTCGEAESHTIYLLFARSFGALHTPSPREIKNIINGMVTTAIQWRNEIPLPLHAYFAILKHGERSGELRTRLIKGKIPLHNDLLGENVAESLVALEYNVHPKIGAQMLYEPIIKRIFAAKSGADDLLTRSSSPGFTAQFDRLIGGVLRENAEVDPVLFVDNVKTLCGIAFFSKTPGASQRNIVREIAKAVEQLKYFSLNINDLVDVIERYIDVDVDKRGAPALSQAIERTVGYFSHDKQRGIFGFNNSQLGNMRVLEVAYRLRHSSKIKVYLNATTPGFAFPGDLNDLHRVLRHFEGKDEIKFLDIFDLSTARSDLVEEIIADKGSSRRLRELIPIHAFLLKRGMTFSSAFYAKITKIITGDRGHGHDSVVLALPYLIRLSSSIPEVRAALTQADSIGFVYFYLGVYNPRLPSQFAGVEDSWVVEGVKHDEKTRLCANLMYLALFCHKSGHRIALDPISSRGEKLYRRIIAKPENHEDLLHDLADIIGGQTALTTLVEQSGREDLGALSARLQDIYDKA